MPGAFAHCGKHANPTLQADPGQGSGSLIKASGPQVLEGFRRLFEEKGI